MKREHLESLERTVQQLKTQVQSAARIRLTFAKIAQFYPSFLGVVEREKLFVAEQVICTTDDVLLLLRKKSLRSFRPCSAELPPQGIVLELEKSFSVASYVQLLDAFRNTIRSLDDVLKAKKSSELHKYMKTSHVLLAASVHG
eukprot:6214593-Pleurochrysis_carterae.AAC.6